MYNSIYPAYIKTYQGLNNKRIIKKNDDERSSQSSAQAENDLNKEKKKTGSESFSRTAALTFPNGEKSAIDYTKRKIGIDQIIIDFKNTTNAIGAPDDIKLEVSSYLSLIENQSKKINPNHQIIQSNLKNASQILDEYITNTLKKPSKVVENWVDALFLQQIDYKSNSSITSTQTVEEENIQKEESITPDKIQVSETVEKKNPVKKDIYVPQDPELKRKFLAAKKYAAIDEKEKALYSFQNAMDYAQEIGDNQTCAMIHYEEGVIYDGFNRIDDALYNYNRAIRQSEDNNIKARAHYSMGKIYDDYVKFEPAVEHLAAAVSFAGEADNLKLQTQALSNLAKMHADRYDKKNALMFMDLTDLAASETHDERVIGINANRNASYCKKLNEKARALEYYKNSAKIYDNLADKEKLAKNYKEAASVMLSFGNKSKAEKLLTKAYIAAQSTDNNELKEEIALELQLSE